MKNTQQLTVLTNNWNERYLAFDLSRDGVSSRFRTDPAGDCCPLWYPDGRRIVLPRTYGQLGAYEKSASGAQTEEILYASVEVY